MVKPKNYYIKYKKAELELYAQDPESCVRRITRVERIKFSPNVIANFKQSIMRILSRKIGKYDIYLDGVVLDFRNTRILNTKSAVRLDTPHSVIKVECNFYVFSPRRNAIINGIVKHINRQSIETVISVVIYRVFNAKIVFKGIIKKDNICHNQEIKMRLKSFHFDHEIPFIEGEMVQTDIQNATCKGLDYEKSMVNSTSTYYEKKDFDNFNQDNNFGIEGPNFFEANYIKKEQEDSSSKYDLANSLLKNCQERHNSMDSIQMSFKKESKLNDTNDVVKDGKVLKEEPIIRELNDNTTKETFCKKKSAKKKKRQSMLDDFESSLRMISNSS